MPRTPTAADIQPLPYRVVFGWGLGSLGLSTILNTLNVLLLAYLTVIVGIEPALAGALILVAKLVDVATDLPVGWASDRTRSGWGPRRPYLLLAALVTPLSMVMLFRPPLGDPVTYVLIAFAAYTTGYTLFNVPYLSMPAELSSNTHERTAMVAHRSAFIAAGTFFGVAAAPYIVGATGGGADGYRVLGLVVAGLVFIGFAGAFALTSWQPQAVRRVQVPFARQLRAVLSNRHFLALMFIKITHLLALAVGAGSLFFFFRYALGYDLKTLGFYGAVTTAAWAISMPGWTRLARMRGKRYGYFVATALYVVVALSWLTAQEGEALHYLIARGAVFGVVSGGMLLMGNAMLQDIMDHDMRSTGEAKNGVFAGTYSLLEKLASGIGAQVLGLVLSLSGFERAAATQSQSAVDGVYLTASVIPAGLMLVSLYAIYRYRLDESRLD